MPNPHYQHVLEQDRALPAPVRWLTRAMSSWWLIMTLSLFVAGTVAFALVPVGGRYLWQHRLIDATQQQVLTGWPLITGAWLLAAVILWAGFRRLPWRMDSLGRMVCVLGLAIILVSQSWAFNQQTTGVAAVPVSPSDASGKPDPLTLTYTTRFGDPTERVLVVMVSGADPVQVPLDRLPRWNDATGEAMPSIKLHKDPALAATVGFETRIVPTAYVADGTLSENEEGQQTATPTPTGGRNQTALPYPSNALLAVEITTDTDTGTTTTTAWLPFEPEGTDVIAPTRFFSVEGRGQIGLAFRPVSRKLPFAMALTTQGDVRPGIPVLYIADADAGGTITQPAAFTFEDLSNTPTYSAYHADGRRSEYVLGLVQSPSETDVRRGLVTVTRQPASLFITAGLLTFVVGVVLDLLLGWLGPAPKRNHQNSTKPAAKPEADGAAA